jgi:diguanylate cyclase (GGDEF)-like protein
LPAHPSDDVEERQAARAEAVAAQVAYRKRVRAAGLAIVFGVGAVLAVSAVLPTTPPGDRVSLLFTAGLTILGGLIWFTLVPRSAFGETRIFVAAAISQAVMIIMLGLTGDSGSIYFAYYLLPILGVILSGNWRQVAGLGALAATGVVGLALSSPLTDAARDITVTRLFQIAAMSFFASATARATGETRRALADRTAALAEQRDDAFAMASTDELTGLYNRHFMRDELRRMTAHASRRDRSFAVLSLDVDGLKEVNDSRGHQAGDVLLRSIADALRAVLRSEDIAVRTGGDEFVVLLPDADRTEAVKVAYRIRQRVAALGETAGHGVSTGIAVWKRGTDPDAALRQADEELYRSKATRRASSA